MPQVSELSWFYFSLPLVSLFLAYMVLFSYSFSSACIFGNFKISLSLNLFFS